MAVENPPLNRLYVLGYAANDRDYPLVSMNLDPRVAGYKVPEDLSTCPDKRYPNHVFTGAQPLSGDERVRHVWEILPSPWVPFTRYDDDLGPIQGRRRSVENTGQQASLASDTKISYEGREGSAIVSTELEETWSIKTDEDGNSLFPLKDRDSYDASRGPVQERRQLFVPTGEEVGSLENVDGVITQTSYEPYNEFLSVKIVQTYQVNGPQLIGKTTNNEGQLVTVTTQRKGAFNYNPPKPTATRTVEASREDAVSLVERIVETPEIFTATTFSSERPDPVPQKFRVKVPVSTTESNTEGTAQQPALFSGQIAKSEQQVNKFVKRIATTTRDTSLLPQIVTQKLTTNEGLLATVTETLQNGDTVVVPSSKRTVESEALGDGTYVVRVTESPKVFSAKTFRVEKADLTPQKFKAKQSDLTTEENIEGTAGKPSLVGDEFLKSEQQVNEFVKRVTTNTRTTDVSSTLTESVITTDGQVASRVLTLSKQNQTISGGAKVIDGSIEELGDGRTIKTLTTVEELLKKEVFSAQKPDVVPEKFRAKLPTTVSSSVLEGSPQAPSLVEGEIEASQQSLGAFTYRKSVTKRADGPYDALDGLDYEETFDLGISYKESIAETPPSGKLKESSPLGDGKYLVREYQTDAIAQELGEFYESYPTTISLDLPRILKSITISYEEDVSLGTGLVEPEYLNGFFNSLTTNLSSKTSGSISYSPKVEVDFETIWGKNLKAKNHIFFLEGPITEEAILEKCGATETWPIFKPRSKTFQLKGVRLSSTLSVGLTRSQQVTENGAGYRQQANHDKDSLRDFEILTVEIPPCLTTARFLSQATPIKYPLEAWVFLPELTDPNTGTVLLPQIRVEQKADMEELLYHGVSIPASTPTDVPRSGIYLMDSNVQFFKYGWFLVTATTLDASQLA